MQTPARSMNTSLTDPSRPGTNNWIVSSTMGVITMTTRDDSQSRLSGRTPGWLRHRKKARTPSIAYSETCAHFLTTKVASAMSESPSLWRRGSANNTKRVLSLAESVPFMSE